MNYYPHHIGDYLKDTAHLTMIEDGAYRRLIDLYYLHEQPLPAEKRQIYRLARATATAEKRAIDSVLVEYFTLTEEGYTHRRCDAEIARSREKSAKAKQSAASRWQGKTHSEGNANAYANAQPPAMRTHSEGNAYPIANNQNKEETSSHAVATAPEIPPSAPPRAPERDDLPDGDPKPAGLLAKTLRQTGVQVAPSNPSFRQWVAAGLDEVEALAGVEIARASKPAPEPIPWAYLAKVLETQRKQAAGDVPGRTAGKGRFAEDIRQMRQMSAWADEQLRTQQTRHAQPPTPSLALDPGATDARHDD